MTVYERRLQKKRRKVLLTDQQCKTLNRIFEIGSIIHTFLAHFLHVHMTLMKDGFLFCQVTELGNKQFTPFRESSTSFSRSNNL